MKIIDRPLYINQLLIIQNTPEINIITGIRRSGKSKLLSIFSQHIKSADPDANIINIDLTKIRDAYPKLLLARTHHEETDFEGVHIIDIPLWPMA